MSGLVRVRFIAQDTWISAAIRRLTGSLFSHVEFGTPEGAWIGAHLDGGIQELPANYCVPSREYYYEIPCTEGDEAALLAWARSQMGTKYDWKDIVGLAIQNRSLRSPHAYICSAFVATGMLLRFGPKRFANVELAWAYRMTPETAHLSPMLAGHLKRRTG